MPNTDELEQLLAESTGKAGKGLIPVDQEKLGPPDVYSNDRDAFSVWRTRRTTDRRIVGQESLGKDPKWLKWHSALN